MLVLSRKKNQQIVIDSNIKIVVLSVRGNTIRLGIEAPPDVPVHREEVSRRIEAEQKRWKLRTVLTAVQSEERNSITLN